MQLPPNLTRYSGPSASRSVSSSMSLDYSGADDLAKKQEALPAAQAAKYAALYGGDIPGSVAAQHRIRDLLDAINNPRQPLVRPSSQSQSASEDAAGPAVIGEHPSLEMPSGEGTAIAPMPVAPPIPQPRAFLPPSATSPIRQVPVARGLAPATDVLSDPHDQDGRKFGSFA